MTLSEPMRRTAIFGALFVVCLVCAFFDPLKFLLGGIYRPAAVIFLILFVGSIFWPYIAAGWEQVSIWLGSTAVFLILFLIFAGASLAVYPVEAALGTFYRILAGICLALLVLSVISQLLRAGSGGWTYQRLPLFRSLKWREAVTGYMFVLPWVVGFLVFSLLPMALSLYASFSHYDIVHFPKWEGLFNYKYMLQSDGTFRISLYNTFWYVIVKTPVVIVASLLLALLMAQQVPGIKFFRTIFYMPTVITGVAAIFLWVWILWPTGLLNRGLAPLQQFAQWATFGHVQAKQILWFFDPSWTKPAMVIMGLWYIGGGALILLAGLTGIPRSLYEAADVEGAGPLRKFFSITIPMLSPTLFFILLTNIIGGFQVFNSAFVISTSAGVGTNPGDPAQSLLFYEVYLYTQFKSLNMGYACALAWFLFVIIMIITAIQLYLSKRWVYYESG
jgi:multiple sugar transport system permease protein